jgi:peptide/nickel transport system permease protein
VLTTIGRRLLAAIPLLLFVSLFVFALLELVPGDAARSVAGETATEEEVAATRERLGLDDPFFVRYFTWLWNALQGDLGTSLYSSEGVTSIIAQRLPITASLAVVALIMAIVVGIPIGILAAVRANSFLDRAVTAMAALLMSVPPFVVGLVLVIVFAINMNVFPATGYSEIAEAGLGGWLQHLILPGIAIASISAAEFARQTRGALVDTLGMDYIRTVRAKGLRQPMIIGKHALKNAGIPIVTVVGLQVGRVLAGAVTVEFVFAIPGFGSLAVQSVNQRDVPVILGIVMVSAVVVIVANILVDLSYGYFNPRTRAHA